MRRSFCCEEHPGTGIAGGWLTTMYHQLSRFYSQQINSGNGFFGALLCFRGNLWNCSHGNIFSNKIINNFPFYYLFIYVPLSIYLCKCTEIENKFPISHGSTPSSICMKPVKNCGFVQHIEQIFEFQTAMHQSHSKALVYQQLRYVRCARWRSGVRDNLWNCSIHTDLMELFLNRFQLLMIVTANWLQN